MSLKERVETFGAATRKYFEVAKRNDFKRNFGVSNGAKIVEGGLQLGVSNLDAFGGNADQFVMGCMIRFPPEDEVYFAIQVKGDLQILIDRLAAMKAKGLSSKVIGPAAVAADEGDDDKEGDDFAGDPLDEIAYSARNNLAVVYLAPDGKLYLRNKQFWESLKFDLSTVGPGVVVDKAIVAVWPPATSARRSLLAREFVGYLSKLIGHGKVHEIRVWADGASVGPLMQRLPATIPIADIEAAISEAGGYYPGGEIRQLHAGLNFLTRKHFVILSGLSGTGKTQLALRYARAVHGITDQEAADPFLFVCAVRPEWTDPTGLTGYHDVLQNQYVVPRFLEAVLLATAYGTSPVFVVLDEMNLARVEYYFSEVLSAMETREALQLHSMSVPLDGTTATSVPAEIPLPPNVYFIGTINVDETTNPISDKVLDRSVVIDMSRVDLGGFLASLAQRAPELGDAIAASGAALGNAHALMALHGLGFGYRVAEEAARYHAFAAEHLKSADGEITDDLMVQKVLVKLRGSERQRSLLTGLKKTLSGMPKSERFLDRLLADLDDFGSFQASR